MKSFLCIIAVIFLASCDEISEGAAERRAEKQKQEQVEQEERKKEKERAERNFAHTGSIRMYFRDEFAKPLPHGDTEYQRRLDKIKEAEEKGLITEHPSGLRTFTIHDVPSIPYLSIGILLPEKYGKTGNGEPIFYECVVREKQTGGQWRSCSTLYFMKKKLRVFYDVHDKRFDDEDEYFLWLHQSARDQIEKYLKENPDFYYNRSNTGERP